MTSHLRILHPHQLSNPANIGPAAICAEKIKCAGTGKGRCVNTKCFHKLEFDGQGTAVRSIKKFTFKIV